MYDAWSKRHDDRSVCLIERPYLLRQLASGIRRDSLSSIRKYVRGPQLRHRTGLSTNLLSIFPPSLTSSRSLARFHPYV